MYLKNIFISLLIFVIPNSLMCNDWIQHTIDLTINTRFDSAETIIHNRFKADDSSLSVYFYYASILNSKMTHYENDQDMAQFTNILDKIIEKSTLLIDNSAAADYKERAKWYFYRGSAYGYLAYVQGKNGKWFKALDNGMASIADLDESVKIDTSLYDAYLGIGVYNYWRSTKLKYMLWLPFVPDLREEGVEQIKLAIKKGRYSAAMGMHQLIYILLDFGRFDEAVPYAKRVIEMYPESQFMRWAHAHVYYKRHEYDKAVQSYFKLLQLIESDTSSNPSHWLFCQTRIAEIYFKQKKYASAVSHAKRALEYKNKSKLKENEVEKMNQAARILAKSQKALQEQ